MLWYGIKSPSQLSKKDVHNTKRRLNLKVRTLSFSLKTYLNFSNYNFFFFLPAAWSLVLIKLQGKKFLNNPYVCYLYSSTYYFKTTIPSTFSLFHYDELTNVIFLTFSLKNNFYRLYWNFFSTIFNSFNKLFFKKIKFRGKGYYVFKNNRNTIALQFGYSHRRRLYSYFISVKFLSKTSIFVFGINKLDLFLTTYALYNTKPINIFTGKGIRFSRQIIYKKAGKVSSYR